MLSDVLLKYGRTFNLDFSNSEITNKDLYIIAVQCSSIVPMYQNIYSFIIIKYILIY